MIRLICAAVLLVVSTTVATAQAPTGTIAGTVLDQVSAVMPGATVTVKNTATGLTRVVVSSAEGSFQVPSLPAGNYDVLVEMPGFQATHNPTEVATGQTTTLRVTLQIGARTEAITVAGTTPLIQLQSNAVQGVVGRAQIDTLPLNGRSFLNLAALQPGVTVVIGNPAQFNAQFNVSVMGAPASRTAITVDGGNVRNPVEGGTGQNFSQEVVQEFQISTANFDLSTGIAGLRRDQRRHALRHQHVQGRRVQLLPQREHGGLSQPGAQHAHRRSAFSREQSGFVFGGPIQKDKVHFFAATSTRIRTASMWSSPTSDRWRGLARWHRRRTKDISSAVASITASTTGTPSSRAIRTTATPTAVRSARRCRRRISCRTRTTSTSSSSASPAFSAARS